MTKGQIRRESGSIMVQFRFAAALLATAMLWHAPASAVDVVVNVAQPETTVSRSLVRGIFGMRVRAWPDGVPVHVFVLDDAAPAHEEFCKSVLQMYPYQLRDNWDRLLYSGTGQPPMAVASEEELLKRVGQTPGAIGYVREYRAPAAAAPVQGQKGKKAKTQPPAPAPAAPVKVLHVQ